jgi:hypothetical protein
VPEVEEEPIRETRDAHVQTDFFTPEMTLKRHTKSNVVWPALELTRSSIHTMPTTAAAAAAAAAAVLTAVSRASSAPQQLLYASSSVMSNGSSTRSSTHFVPHIQRDEGGLWEGLVETEPDVLFYTDTTQSRPHTTASVLRCSSNDASFSSDSGQQPLLMQSRYSNCKGATPVTNAYDDELSPQRSTGAIFTNTGKQQRPSTIRCHFLICTSFCTSDCVESSATRDKPFQCCLHTMLVHSILLSDHSTVQW